MCQGFCDPGYIYKKFDVAMLGSGVRGRVVSWPETECVWDDKWKSEVGAHRCGKVGWSCSSRQYPG
jgi:hypothetical protein